MSPLPERERNHYSSSTAAGGARNLIPGNIHLYLNSRFAKPPLKIFLIFASNGTGRPRIPPPHCRESIIAYHVIAEKDRTGFRPILSCILKVWNTLNSRMKKRTCHKIEDPGEETQSPPGSSPYQQKNLPVVLVYAYPPLYVHLSGRNVEFLF